MSSGVNADCLMLERCAGIRIIAQCRAASQKIVILLGLLTLAMPDTNDFNSLHTIDTVKGHASFLPLACGFVCVRFTLPSPHPFDSVKGHATFPPLLQIRLTQMLLIPVLNCCIQRL
ncbi:hypothetical protein TNCV_4150941 [Trichonephila clavipes]|nr:hypothetical protein TNCV_4150941 [Trichonephila clavipes]